MSHSWSTFGNIDFEQVLRIDMIYRHNFRFVSWEGRYQYTNVDVLDPMFNYLHGTQHALQLSLDQEFSRNRFSLEYDYEINHRNDFQSTTIFRSYSPSRHTVSIGHEYHWSKLIQSLELQYRWSDYGKPDRFNTINSVREEGRSRIVNRLDWNFNDHWKVRTKFSYLDNSSNIAGKSYSRSEFELGVAWQF